MTITTLERRLRTVESRQGLHGDLDRMTDAQLWRIIRRNYRQLAREHGSLAQAVIALQASGDPDNLAHAGLIEEDTGGPDAIRH